MLIFSINIFLISQYYTGVNVKWQCRGTKKGWFSQTIPYLLRNTQYDIRITNMVAGGRFGRFSLRLIPFRGGQALLAERSLKEKPEFSPLIFPLLPQDLYFADGEKQSFSPSPFFARIGHVKRDGFK